MLLRYNLEAEGHEVDVIARGDEADIRLREEVPDLLILDWMLPGLSGVELFRRLRQRGETERLPIAIFGSRFASEPYRDRRGYLKGAVSYHPPGRDP